MSTCWSTTHPKSPFPPGQLTQRRLVAPPAAGIPRPRTPLPPGQQTLVGLVLRRLSRRRATEHRDAVHRAGKPARLEHCSGPGGPPSAGLHPRPEGRSTGPHSGSTVVEGASPASGRWPSRRPAPQRYVAGSNFAARAPTYRSTAHSRGPLSPVVTSAMTISARNRPGARIPAL